MADAAFGAVVVYIVVAPIANEAFDTASVVHEPLAAVSVRVFGNGGTVEVRRLYSIWSSYVMVSHGSGHYRRPVHTLRSDRNQREVWLC